MRRAKGVLGVIVGLMLLAHAGGTALANDPPGNNGDIKVHSGAGESDEINANQPHPGCTFHLHGFNFDENSSGWWHIEGQGGTAGSSTADGTWHASSSGEWRTAVMTLSSGHYKATAKQTAPGTPGGEKQKVFWIECGGGSTTAGGSTSSSTGGSTTTGSTTSTSGSTTTGGSTSTSASGSTTGAATSTTGTAGTTGSTGGTGGTASTTGTASSGGGQGNITGGDTNVATTTAATTGGPAVAGAQASSSAPMTLPSTSTGGQNAPLMAIGGFLVAIGAFMLRRPGPSR